MIQVFQHPFTLIMAAPSGSGKTSLAFRIIQNSRHLVSNTGGKGFDCLFVVYRSQQPIYSRMQEELNIPVFFYEKTLPVEFPKLVQQYEAPLVMIDDGINSDNEDMIVQLFCRLSHHLNVSVLLIGHTLFDSKNQSLRICHRNCNALIIFDSPRDNRSLQTLVHQIVPEKKKAQALLQSIHEVFETPYNYFLFDFQKSCPSSERFKSNILCERGEYPIVHIFKKDQSSFPL